MLAVPSINIFTTANENDNDVDVAMCGVNICIWMRILNSRASLIRFYYCRERFFFPFHSANGDDDERTWKPFWITTIFVCLILNVCMFYVALCYQMNISLMRKKNVQHFTCHSSAPSHSETLYNSNKFYYAPSSFVHELVRVGRMKWNAFIRLGRE
jgi:hypothetical protein